MGHFIITGTSRGIGHALAENCLSGGHIVTGISRSRTIDHPSYKHFSVDLAEDNFEQKIVFPGLDPHEEITLVNNSAVTGNLKRLGNEKADEIRAAYKINLVAPHILMNLFLEKYRNHQGRKTIINISSGAARSPIDAWSEYCSSKAGIDMLTRIASLEAGITGDKTKFYSVSPGVVDTAMQKRIRETSPLDFSRLKDFIAYKSRNELEKPDLIAKKIMVILANSDQFTEVSVSLREVENK